MGDIVSQPACGVGDGYNNWAFQAAAIAVQWPGQRHGPRIKHHSHAWECMALPYLRPRLVGTTADPEIKEELSFFLSRPSFLLFPLLHHFFLLKNGWRVKENSIVYGGLGDPPLDPPLMLSMAWHMVYIYARSWATSSSWAS